jgi:hypothetical protein
MSSARVRVWECLRDRQCFTVGDLLDDIDYEIDVQQVKEYLSEWIEMQLVFVREDGRYAMYSSAFHTGIPISFVMDRIAAHNHTLLYICNERIETYLERYLHKDVLSIVMLYVRAN